MRWLMHRKINKLYESRTFSQGKSILFNQFIANSVNNILLVKVDTAKITIHIYRRKGYS